MNFTEFTDLIAGLLQFVVAGYALRLNRLFGARRVGWSLFSAFALLALLHVMQFAIPAGGIASGVKVEVLYTLISLLLLTGMIHLESVLKERERVERAELRMRTQLEMEVQIKTGHLFDPRCRFSGIGYSGIVAARCGGVRIACTQRGTNGRS